MPDTSENVLFDTVVAGGYCVGCGACAAVSDSVTMGFNGHGQYHPIRKTEDGHDAADVLTVCPFSGAGANEDEIATDLYADSANHNREIGYYCETLAGHVAEGAYRHSGSSGGMGSWILNELMEKGLIDAAVHVKTRTSGEANVLFEYSVSTSTDQLREGSKSKYYPIELSRVVEQIRRSPGRYAVVGLPCFIKAIRLLARQDEVLNERVHYCIGLVCGHLKSRHFADLFAWQCGIPPGNLTEIDFRHKLPGEQANAYGIRVSGHANGEYVEAVRQNKSFFGYLWGHGFFKYQACDYCDDVFSETADLTIGDAWLPGFVEDSLGSNVVIVRRPDLSKLLRAAMDEGRLKFSSLSPEEVAESQAAGLRHRRDGLQYRLWRKQQSNDWFPPKRVEPGHEHLSERYKKIFDGRLELAAQSHKAFQDAIRAGDFKVFRAQMKPLLQKYNALYPKSFQSRAKAKLLRIARSVLRRVRPS